MGSPTVMDSGDIVGRLMAARLKRIQTPGDLSSSHDSNSSRQRVNYRTARSEEDQFPDPSLLDPVDAHQHESIRAVVKSLIEEACKNSLPAKCGTQPRQVID